MQHGCKEDCPKAITCALGLYNTLAECSVQHINTFLKHNRCLLLWYVAQLRHDWDIMPHLWHQANACMASASKDILDRVYTLETGDDTLCRPPGEDTHTHTGRWIDEWMNGWLNAWLDRQTDGGMDALASTPDVSLEGFCHGGEVHRREGCGVLNQCSAANLHSAARRLFLHSCKTVHCPSPGSGMFTVCRPRVRTVHCVKGDVWDPLPQPLLKATHNSKNASRHFCLSKEMWQP